MRCPSKNKVDGWFNVGKIIACDRAKLDAQSFALSLTAGCEDQATAQRRGRAEPMSKGDAEATGLSTLFVAQRSRFGCGHARGL